MIEEPTNISDNSLDPYCYCCFRQFPEDHLEQRSPTIDQMTMSYCQECIENKAEPSFIVDGYLNLAGGDLDKFDEWFSELIVFCEGYYLTVEEYFTEGGYSYEPVVDEILPDALAYLAKEFGVNKEVRAMFEEA